MKKAEGRIQCAAVWKFQHSGGVQELKASLICIASRVGYETSFQTKTKGVEGRTRKMRKERMDPNGKV